MNKPAARRRVHLQSLLGAVAALSLSGCDLLTVSQTGRNIREGNDAVVRGEVQKAQQHFEAALDGTMLSAEAHYRLGLLYEDQLKNEVGALHHFERYLELAPQGQFATDVKGYVDRLRLLIVSRLANGPVTPARETTRLKNENLALKQQLTDLRQMPPGRAPTPVPASTPPPSAVATPAMVVAATPPPAPVAPATSTEPEVRRALPVSPGATAAQTEGDTAIVTHIAQGAPAAVPAAAPVASGSRTYQVKSGDTLAGIARQFYKNSGQWQKIAEANKGTLSDPTKLKPGMVLVIPE